MDLLRELKKLLLHIDPSGDGWFAYKEIERLIKKYGWHDISEKPEVNKPVLAYLEKSVIRVMYVPPFTNTEDSYDGDDVVYNEEKDEYYWPEGWYEWNLYDEIHYRVDEPVLAWMSLPDPYKKEE